MQYIGYAIGAPSMRQGPTMSRPTDPFDWSGGHPALDFVNTLDERPFDQPIENLAGYRDLLRFSELAGLIEPALARRLGANGGPTAARIARRARALREHLFNVLAAFHRRESAAQGDLQAIAVAIRSAHAARVLVSPS